LIDRSIDKCDSGKDNRQGEGRERGRTWTCPHCATQDGTDGTTRSRARDSVPRAPATRGTGRDFCAHQTDAREKSESESESPRCNGPVCLCRCLSPSLSRAPPAPPCACAFSR
jgi:hypothetical protein